MRETGAASINSTTDRERFPDEGSERASENQAEVKAERLYEDYAARVYRYCLSRLDSPEEAEDALQATYLNAWRSLSRGTEPISARPWLFQIAANVCSSMLRTRLTGASVELRSPETFDRIPTHVEPNDDLLGLSAALAGLPERQRRALLLRDWRGLSYDEIAAELDSSYQAVETLLFRARKSVAAGLRKVEPAKVPVRARALAPLPLLLSFKHGVSSLKSALTAGAAPIKVSLGIALGAAAPLVAYGLLERGISHPPATQKAAAPTVQLETPLTYAVPVPPRRKTPVHEVAPTKSRSSQPLAEPSSQSGGGGDPTGVSNDNANGQGHHSPSSPEPRATASASSRRGRFHSELRDHLPPHELEEESHGHDHRFRERRRRSISPTATNSAPAQAERVRLIDPAAGGLPVQHAAFVLPVSG